VIHDRRPRQRPLPACTTLGLRMDGSGNILTVGAHEAGTGAGLTCDDVDCRLDMGSAVKLPGPIGRRLVAAISPSHGTA